MKLAVIQYIWFISFFYCKPITALKDGFILFLLLHVVHCSFYVGGVA